MSHICLKVTSDIYWRIRLFKLKHISSSCRGLWSRLFVRPLRNTDRHCNFKIQEVGWIFVNFYRKTEPLFPLFISPWIYKSLMVWTGKCKLYIFFKWYYTVLNHFIPIDLSILGCMWQWYLNFCPILNQNRNWNFN